MFRLFFSQPSKFIQQKKINQKFFQANYATRPNYMFDKILIANRGEIACRVIRTARKLGIKTVAVFSEADKNSMHVQMADEAFHIGNPPARESYLRMEKIMDVAKKTGAQAIHPGYGFLSENAEFSEYCSHNNVVFIGPPPNSIRAMGSKSASKEIMINAKVPVVPGYHGDNQSLPFLREQAKSIGYPVLIKAIMGGGGKGMRIVEREEDLEQAIESSRREAASSFGDDTILIEKYLRKPRHIEFQIFADKHDNCVYLFERDCSVQRRHQKVIEEAPAPGMTEERRKEMGIAAVNAAKAVGYEGAGTVEFIVNEDGSFYFMEMNTRLQVEHPITEMITKQDLVEWQLLVAAGHPLPKKQEDLQIHGHAFEARIYAENPDANFLPGTGKLLYLSTPTPSENIRIDTGVRQGDEVSVFYDPMIAKLIVWGPDRLTALRRTLVALEDYNIVGLHTNVNFLRRLCNHHAFIDGQVTTKYIEEYRDELITPKEAIAPGNVAMTALYMLLLEQNELKKPSKGSPWSQLSGRRFNHQFTRQIKLLQNETPIIATVTYEENPQSKIQDYSIAVNGETFIASGSLDGYKLTSTINGRRADSTVVQLHNVIYVFNSENVFELSLPVASYGSSAIEKGSMLSPMPGRVIQVNVKEGDTVKKGDLLMIIEAMKMEHQIKATSDGVVGAVYHKAGDLVEEKKVLITIK